MSARTHTELRARERTVRDAYLDAADRYREVRTDREHRDELVEWALIKSACKRELEGLKGQITKAARREGLRA